MGFSEKKHQVEGGGLESEGMKQYWVISGISSRVAHLRPINTEPSEKNSSGGGEEDEECSTTPTAKEARIPEKLPCPPAPKKRKPPRPVRCQVISTEEPKEFFNPPDDLETVFIRPQERAK